MRAYLTNYEINMDKKEANLVPLICRNEESSSSESSDESTDNEEPLTSSIISIDNDTRINTNELKKVNRTKVSKQLKKKQTKWSTYWSRYKRFVDSPRVHFTYDAIFYIIFLALFSYMILCEFDYYISEDNKSNDTIESNNSSNFNYSNQTTKITEKIVKTPSYIEYLLIFWVIAFIIEEIRQVCSYFFYCLNFIFYYFGYKVFYW